MSRYSGKCDFCDWLDSRDDAYVEKSKIYVYDENYEPILLGVKTIRDCIPYYTHIVASAGTTKESGTICLTQHSWLKLERLRYGVLGSHSWHRQEINELMEDNGFEPMFTKEECRSDFWSKFDVCGNLYLVANVFKDYVNDILICKDDDDNVYLVKTIDRVKGEYIITPFTKEDFLSVLNSEVTFEEFIKSNPISYLTHYDISQDALVSKKRNSDKMGKQYFKKVNVYFKDKCEDYVSSQVRKELEI